MQAWWAEDLKKIIISLAVQKLFTGSVIKSNQITFIVTSPQHKCLGEWNSWERAPDSVETIYSDSTYLQTVQKTMCKNTYIYSVHTVHYKDILSYQYTNTHYTPLVHVLHLTHKPQELLLLLNYIFFV